MDGNYYKRTLELFIKKAAKQFPILLVVGSRQVGKTTLLRHLQKKSRTYITLDDPKIALLAKEDPALFMQRFKPPLLIDEIQYAPELLPYLKIYVDENKKPGDFWITGSQQFHLMQNVSESLAGRVGIVNLLGLSLNELRQEGGQRLPFLPTKAISKSFKKMSLDEIYTYIWKGSFPALWQTRSRVTDKELFYNSYVQTYIQRDVRDLANVGDEGSFLKFLRAAAARTGQLLNLADIARDAAISPNTAKRWLSILQTSGIIYLLEPYHTNVTKRLVKTPKLYFLDTGLCTYLTEWTSAKTLEAGAFSGHILETFMFTEILKSYWHNGKKAPFYFYRDKDKQEIDLIIIQNNKIYPIEFKKTASPNKSMISSFSTLKRLNKNISQGSLICLSDTAYPLTKDVHVLPVELL